MDINQKIEELLTNNNVVLFMKGTKQFPQCGFSGRAVQILKSFGIEFKDINILEDNEMRQGIKDYANWPTIPQIYIKGEFIGGSDILSEMYQSGEFLQLLKDKQIL